MSETKTSRGGTRAGAGRPKISGTRHYWVVPDDVETIFKAKGAAYLWDAVRFKFKLDEMQIK